MSLKDNLGKLIKPETPIFLLNLINLIGIFYIVFWLLGLVILLALGLFEERYSIYYVIPLILGYYSLYLRFKIDEKINEVDENIKPVMEAFKLNRSEAKDYVLKRIENETFAEWLKFHIIFLVIMSLIIGIFYI